MDSKVLVTSYFLRWGKRCDQQLFRMAKRWEFHHCCVCRCVRVQDLSARHQKELNRVFKVVKKHQDHSRFGCKICKNDCYQCIERRCADCGLCHCCHTVTRHTEPSLAYCHPTLSAVGTAYNFSTCFHGDGDPYHAKCCSGINCACRQYSAGCVHCNPPAPHPQPQKKLNQ